MDEKSIEVIQTELSNMRESYAHVTPIELQNLVELCYYMSVKMYEYEEKIYDLERKLGGHSHQDNGYWGKEVVYD